MLREIKRGTSSRKNEMQSLFDRLHNPNVTLQELGDIESEIMMHYIQLPGTKGIAQRIQDYFKPDTRSNQEQIDTLRMGTGEPLSQIYPVSKELRNEIWEFAQECKTNKLKFLMDPSKKEELKRMDEMIEFNRELTEGTPHPNSMIAKSQKVTEQYKDKLLAMIFSNEDKAKAQVQADRDLRIKLARVANIYQPKNASRSQIADLIFDTSKKNPSNIQRNEDTQKQLRLKILTSLRKLLLKRREQIYNRMMGDEPELPTIVEGTERTYHIPGASTKRTESTVNRGGGRTSLTRARSFGETSRDKKISTSMVSRERSVIPDKQSSSVQPAKMLLGSPQQTPVGKASERKSQLAKVFKTSFEGGKHGLVGRTRLEDSAVVFEDSEISGVEHSAGTQPTRPGLELTDRVRDTKSKLAVGPELLDRRNGKHSTETTQASGQKPRFLKMGATERSSLLRASPITPLPNNKSSLLTTGVGATDQVAGADGTERSLTVPIFSSPTEGKSQLRVSERYGYSRTRHGSRPDKRCCQGYEALATEPGPRGQGKLLIRSIADAVQDVRRTRVEQTRSIEGVRGVVRAQMEMLAYEEEKDPLNIYTEPMEEMQSDADIDAKVAGFKRFIMTRNKENTEERARLVAANKIVSRGMKASREVLVKQLNQLSKKNRQLKKELEQAGQGILATSFS